MKPTLPAVACAVLLASGVFSLQVEAQTPVVNPTQVVSFGNSLSDQGNIAGTPDTNTAAQSGMGIGGVWVQQFATQVNFSLVASNNGGTNYAQAGAITGKSPSNINTLTQVNNYLASTTGKTGGTASPTALYAIFAGSNDIINAIGTTTMNSVAVTAADNLKSQIDSLAKAGGLNFVWLNMAPLDLAPRYFGTSSAPSLAAADSAFNNEWSADIAALKQKYPRITLIGIDQYSITVNVYNNPSTYGFTDVTDIWTTAPKTIAFSAHSTNPNSDKFLSWDGLHPTTHFDQILATDVYNTLPGVVIPSPLAGLNAGPGSGQITLSWSAATAATSYAIFRSTGAGAYSQIASGVTGTSYIDTGLNNGTTYNYQVIPVNAMGQGQAGVVSCAPVPLPGVPGGVSAVPGDGQATLSWTAVTGASSYVIKRATVSGGPYATVGTSNVAGYTDTGLTDNTTYYYVVAAVGVSGQGGNSSEVSAQPSNRPLNLAAASGNAQVALTWTASYGSPTGYNVYRTTTSGTGYAQIAHALTTTSYTDTGVTNGTTYYYIVTGIYSYGEGSASAQVSARPLPPIPAAPSGIRAGAGNAQISLSWNAVPYAASYTIGRSTFSGGPYTPVASGITTTGYVDTGLSNGTTYYYVVNAVNLAGAGPNSTEVNGLPLPPLPAAPTSLLAVGQTQAINLTWNAPTYATSYNIKRTTTPGGPYTTVANSVTAAAYSDTGLAAGTTYYYVISAVDLAGEGPNSSEANATTAPGVVTGLSTLVGSDQVTLSWSAPAGAASYTLERSDSSGGPYAVVASGLTTTSYVDTGLSSSTTYYYVVVAVNSGGTSTNSTEVNGTPLPPLPAAPTNLSAVGGSQEIGLSWTAPAYAAAYNIKRSMTSGGPYTTVATGVIVAAFSDTSASAGTTYYYVVSAVDPAGEGPNSSEASALTAPGVVTGLNAVVGTDLVTLGWNAPAGAASYNIERATVAGGPYATVASGITTTTYVDTGLSSTTTYYYVVVALNSGGASVGSTEVNGTPLPPLPAAPTGIFATGSTQEVDLSWTAPTYAASYNIKRSTTSGGPYATVASGVTAAAYNDTGLTVGTTYYYVISAVNAAGEGANSSETSATTAPDVVTGVTAMAGDGQVGINWNSVPSAASYTIGRSTVSGGPYATVASGLTTNGYVDTGLSDGTTYFYVVSGVNAAGAGPNSIEVSGLPLPPLPVAPSGVSAVGTTQEVELTWSAPTNAASYNIKRSTTSGGPYSTVATGVTGTAYNDTGLAAGTTYYYVISAVDLAGEGPNSSEANAATVPGEVTGVTAVAGSNQVTLSWTAPAGASSYTIERSDSSDGIYVVVASGLTTTNYVDTGLNNGATYYYVVVAVNSSGTSADSTPDSSTPGVPVGLAGVPGDGQATLSWTAVAGADSYVIERAAVSGGPYEPVGASTDAAYIDTGLADGTTYFYVVAAVIQGEQSSNSSEINVQPSNQPMNLAAVPDNAQVALTWTASYGSPTGYNVYRTTTSGTDYDQVASGLTTTSYTDAGLTNGTTYYYVVTGVYSYGEGSASAEVSALPVLPPIPAAASGFTAGASDGQVSLSWNAVPYAATYTVQRSTVSGGPYTTVADGITTTDYVDTGLSDGTTYYYVVSAVNAAGSGPNTTEVSGLPLPPLPATPTAVAAVGQSQEVDLSWNAPTYAASYNVKRSTTAGGPYATVASGITVAAYSDTSLAAGTTYFYVVSAVNLAGEGPNSSETSATTAPGAVTGVTALAGNNQVGLDWSSVTSAASYNVERSTLSGGPYITVASGLTAPGYVDSGLSNGTTYYYVVSALNGSGVGPNSTEVSALPVPPLPAAPTGVVAVGTTQEIDLIWNAPTYAASYNIKRSATAGGPYTTVASGVTVAAYSDTGRAAGTTYYYVVSAVDLAGEGANSSEASAATAPGVVTGVVAIAGNAQVGLNWSPALGAASYLIGRSTVSGGPYITVASGITTTNWVDTGLSNGTTYYYVVSALNGSGAGPNSTEVSGLPLPPLPAAPTGILPVGRTQEIDLSWNGPTYAASYNVKRSTTAGGPYTTVASGVTVAAYSDTGLATGTTYYYVISAVNLAGEGPNSSEANAMTAPGGVAGVTALAGNNQVGLNWNAVPGASAYTVGRSTVAGGPYTTAGSGITTTNFVDSSASNGTTYYYVISAVNAAGAGPASTEVSAEPLPPIPATPSGLAAVAGDTQTVLSWNASTSAASYNLKRATTSGGPYATVASPTGTTYTDTGLTDNTTYYYVISAVDLGGESGNSTEVNATPVSPLPAAVAGLGAVPNSNQVTLTWNAASRASTYTVGRATVSGGPYTTITSGLAALTFVDTGVTNGTTYFYVVTAVNSFGPGLSSTEISSMPAAQNLYWDTTTVAGLANGNGTWDIGVTHTWSNSNAGTSNPLLSWLNDDAAYFQTGGALTATIASGTTIKVGSINQAVSGTAATVTGGTLQIDTNGGITNAVGGGNGALTINSALALNSPNVTVDNETTAGNIALNGVVSETGGGRAITKSGVGGLTFSKANTFSGGLTITGGEVSNGANSNLALFGTGPITLASTTGIATPTLDVANTAFTFNNNFVVLAGTQNRIEFANASTVAFTGTITGGGWLQLSSLLGPAYQFAGDLTQFPGTLQLVGNGATGGTTTYYDFANTSAVGAPQTAIRLDAGAESTNSGNTVALRWNPATTTSATIPIGALTSSYGSAQSAGNVLLQNAKASTTATFQIGALSTSGTFTGTIKNGTGTVAIDKVGSGTLTLSGSNTYTGTTTVDGGALIVNSSLGFGSAVTVNPGGTLGGSGTINGPTSVVSGGVLAPGHGGIATLSLSGGLSLNAGGILNFDLGAASSSDKIVVTGSYVAPTTGTVTVNLSALTGFGAGTYTLITGASGISASSFTLGATPPGYSCQLSASGSALSVTVIAPPTAPTGLAGAPYNSEIGLTWTASPGATSYNVMRSIASGGPYTTIATGVTATSYLDSGLTNGTAYYYVVSAINLAGASGNSNQSVATPVANAIADPWSDGDIGSVAQAGGSTYSAGTYTLSGSGTGIKGTSDGFNYTEQTLVGDGTIIARVASQTGGEGGVMIRGTLAANSPYVDVLLQQGVGAEMQYRSTVGGTTTTGGTLGSATAPYWVKLARTGNAFVGSVSPDGVTWTQLRNVTVTMGSSVTVGLAQSSVTNTSLATGTFDNVSIVPASAWASQDIGAVQNAGASYYSNAIATINGSGADIGSSADQFRYTYLPASGDCDITARVTGVSNTDPWAKAGVMIRESLAVGSTHAAVYVTPGNGVAFQWRSTTNGTTGTVQTARLIAPYWVRIARSGSTFTASSSPDGTTWTVMGTQTITMATNIYIGLPVCSHNATAICTGTLDNITADP